MTQQTISMPTLIFNIRSEKTTRVVKREQQIIVDILF